MSDFSKIAAEFADMVKTELDNRETGANARIAEANLVTAILAKQVLALPEDLMVIAKCEKTTAYKIMAHADFPSTFILARQQFVRKEDFMAALPVVGKSNGK